MSARWNLVPVLAIGTLVALSGCGTPEPVQKLTVDTNANIGTIKRELDYYAKTSNAKIAKSAENIASQRARSQSLSSDGPRAIALEAAGREDLARIYASIIEFVRAADRDPRTFDQTRQAMLALVSQSTPPTKQLAEIEDRLAKLLSDKDASDFVEALIPLILDIAKETGTLMQQFEAKK
jgi:hypothetical protein